MTAALLVGLVVGFAIGVAGERHAHQCDRDHLRLLAERDRWRTAARHWKFRALAWRATARRERDARVQERERADGDRALLAALGQEITNDKGSNP